MVERLYRKVPGMALDFVSGELVENASERAMGYRVVFNLRMDFLNFKVMAGQYIPGYLDAPLNAIRPEFDGLAYHHAYNYFFDWAGRIRDNAALFRVFSDEDYYSAAWSSGGLEQRYDKPELKMTGDTLQITAGKYFRHEDGRPVQVGELPVARFQAALNLMHSDVLSGDTAPYTVVVLGYAEEDMVDVEGVPMNRGMRYMKTHQLTLGPIAPERILTAG
ncbi:hypothetical protein [Pseudomonas koreensis]|uniref:Uncharacterized protein n=1 Tax=Pseudomonas koreensis TaxID=198620 RepID=A0A9X3B4Q2_9PSED|nr:hypothetical protein [Pseudomonas koreensis]MCU7250622.1 hypothetical protein [Pseudomonas koreensis]